MSDKINWKYNEPKILLEKSKYLEGTYDQHYVGNKDIQTVDFWHSLGSLDTTARDNAIKYLARYGKKSGKNRKDLIKAIHYIILMMWDLEQETANEQS